MGKGGEGGEEEAAEMRTNRDEDRKAICELLETIIMIFLWWLFGAFVAYIFCKTGFFA